MSWFKPSPPKPDPEITYRIGFACANGHVQSVLRHRFIGSDEEEVCSTCGLRSDVAVIKRTFKPRLIGLFRTTWVTDAWSEYSDEFVRYLDEDPRIKLSDEILTKLKVRAARDMTRHIATEDLTTYTYGLQDGETMTALWMLEEIQKETK
jgi:hypothetical protein